MAGELRGLEWGSKRKTGQSIIEDSRDVTIVAHSVLDHGAKGSQRHLMVYLTPTSKSKDVLRAH